MRTETCRLSLLEHFDRLSYAGSAARIGSGLLASDIIQRVQN